MRCVPFASASFRCPSVPRSDLLSPSDFLTSGLPSWWFSRIQEEAAGRGARGVRRHCQPYPFNRWSGLRKCVTPFFTPPPLYLRETNPLALSPSVENNEVSDYLQEGDAGFKKPKKKKKRSARVVEADEDRRQPTPAGGDSMDVDGPVASSSTLPPPPPPPIENYVDDDELQSALARQRRQKSKKVAKHTPEEIAKQRECPLPLSPTSASTGAEPALVFLYLSSCRTKGRGAGCCCHRSGLAGGRQGGGRHYPV